MLRIIEYTVFFVAVVLLQVFLFSNVNLGIYIHPLVYVAFIVLLPMETTPIAVLLLGLFTGCLMDVSTGSAGLHTIATVFVSFLRPYFLPLVVGREEVKEGGVPLPSRLGYGRFFRYVSTMVFLHCLVFFTFESLSWQYYHLTLVRVLASTVVTVILVFFAQMPLSSGRETAKSYQK